MDALVKEAGLGEQIKVDSAGTAAYHAGEQPDARARATAEAHGVTLNHAARQFVTDDFARFDYVIAMDTDNRDHLLALDPSGANDAKVSLCRSYDVTAAPDADVPDPYYGGRQGFEEVYEICERACRGLLEHIRTTHRLK